MKIQEMTAAERPREKLLARGPESLGDAELLAILLRSGRHGESAVEMAHRLLGLAGGRLTGLFEWDSGYLASMEGVGPSRAAALGAAFELGRRFLQEQAPRTLPIRDPAQINSLMLPRLKGLGHEECWAILLDRKSLISKMVRMTTGGSRSTVMDIPAIIRIALENSASSIIMVHNHPNGSPQPSRQDIKETQTLRDACSACSLRLLDHIIISDHSYYSMSEEKIY